MRYERIVNSLLVVILMWGAYRYASGYFRDQKMAGQAAPRFAVPLLGGAGAFDSAATDRPLAVVFWATWCGPCEIELTRVNRLIQDHEIKPESVLAISSFEERALVERVVKDRKYLFPVGLDSTGEVARLYGVEATPTIVFISKTKNVEWKTRGLSPMLGFRLTRFLNN